MTDWLSNWLFDWLTAVNSRATHVFQRFTGCLCHFLTAPAGAGFTNRLSLLFLSATLAVLHSLSLSAPPPMLSFLLVHSSVCSFPCFSLPLFFLSLLLNWVLSILPCTLFPPASDIQTLPRVYFFDSYATLQANGSDSRFLSSSCVGLADIPRSHSSHLTPSPCVVSAWFDIVPCLFSWSSIKGCACFGFFSPHQALNLIGKFGQNWNFHFLLLNLMLIWALLKNFEFT